MFNAGVQHEGAYVLVVAAGRAGLPELCALAPFSAKIASMRGCQRVLIDLLAVDRLLSPDENTLLGAQLDVVFRNIERVASVRPQPLTSSSSRIRVFSTLEEANQWLIAE